eukprot:1288469-Lingulodinium_polyedra.AAC.1
MAADLLGKTRPSWDSATAPYICRHRFRKWPTRKPACPAPLLQGVARQANNKRSSSGAPLRRA